MASDLTVYSPETLGISHKVNPDALDEAGPKQEETSHPHPGARQRPPFPSLLLQGAVCINSLRSGRKLIPYFSAPFFYWLSQP